MVSSAGIESDEQRQLAGGRSNTRSNPSPQKQTQPSLPPSSHDMDVKRVVVVYEPWMNGNDKSNKQQQEVLDRIRDLTLRDATENIAVAAGTMVTPPPTITLSTAVDEPVAAPPSAAGANKATPTNGPKDAAPSRNGGGGLLGVPKIDLAVKERRPPMQATFT